jgi:hypothetical protein
MGISEQQRMFLEDALLVNTLKTISDSRFGSSRPVYKVAPTDKEKEKEFAQKCAEFRNTLKAEPTSGVMKDGGGSVSLVTQQPLCCAGVG